MLKCHWPGLALFLGAVALGGSAPAQDDGAGSTTLLKSGEFTADINGLKLWYKVSGVGPVCLMPNPAWGPSSDLYFRTLKPLEKHFTLVYLDSRGTGRSERAKSGKEYTWEHLVADLDDVRRHLKQERIWLMGHSLGGVQILHYVCQHTDRVKGLVLLNTRAEMNNKDKDIMSRVELRKNEAWFGEAVMAMRITPKTDEQFAEAARKSLPLFWSDPKKIANFEKDFAATTLSAAAKLGQMESKRIPFDLTEKLKKVKSPALIVVGDDDYWCSPVAARRLHLCLSNSKLLHIEKSGHFPWMEQPEDFFDQVPKFLESLGVVPLRRNF
jgi:proline iminopeptidase